MAQTKRAKKAEKDIITRLADAGEDAIQRLGELPGGKVMVETANAFRERMDDLAARIRRINPLEKRVTAIEKRLDSRARAQVSGAAPSRPPHHGGLRLHASEEHHHHHHHHLTAAQPIP